MITLGKLVEFVLKHRKGRAFNGYNTTTIAQEILDGMKSNTLRYAINEREEIVGIVCAAANPVNKTLYVHDILTTESWVLSKFVNDFQQTFAGWSIHSTRRCGKVIRYNTQRLIRLILNSKGVR